ncbi:MAG: NAD(P)/FAD-dependent oxidoreductase, partial [Sulfuricurvum sp.]|nr:NAD(P)/FAD-dependent oxidoreductase [Sulfuricurvum sp.]
MSSSNKVAIIGGGASGLMAALFASRAGADVTVYEHNSGVGKKILASGNGRCNIINTTATFEDYAGNDPHFVTYALKQLNFHYFEKFCNSIGLILDVKDDGRCYPLSNEAKSVLIAFKSAVSESGVKILTDSKVTAITKEDSHFCIQSQQGKHSYNKVLIATGSEAAPQLGASADG